MSDKKKITNAESYFTFEDLAVVHLGGQHPDNISALTKEQKGKNYLFPSSPPRPSFEYTLTKESKTIFDLYFASHLKSYLKSLAHSFVANDTIEESELIDRLEIILGLSIRTIMQFKTQVETDTKNEWENLDDISLKILNLKEKTSTTRDEVIHAYNSFIAINLAYILNNLDLRSYFMMIFTNSEKWKKTCEWTFETVLA